MAAVETNKQNGLTNVITVLERVSVQPVAVKTWGVTAGSALIGATAMAVSAQGVLALATLLAMPPLAVTVGALGGGLLGWRYMRNQQAKPVGRAVATSPCLCPDDLTLINGITPAYAERLRAAGICTFAQLAELLPERVHLIIGPSEDENIIQSRRWIADARQFAQRKKDKVSKKDKVTPLRACR